MTSAQTRRILTLIVHPADTTCSIKWPAIQKAVYYKGIDIIHLRSHETYANVNELLNSTKNIDQELRNAAHQLRNYINKYRAQIQEKGKNTYLIVNGPLQIARECNADGWHLKEQYLMQLKTKDTKSNSIPLLLRNVRAQNNFHMLGASVHSIESAQYAQELGLDYIQVGTMYPTPSHPEKPTDLDVEGPKLLQDIRRRISMPIIAVGGIQTRDHVQLVLSSGANGVAIIRGILAADDVYAAIHYYRQLLDT